MGLGSLSIRVTILNEGQFSICGDPSHIIITGKSLLGVIILYGSVGNVSPPVELNLQFNASRNQTECYLKISKII